MRYKADPEPFEWLRSYADLKSWIREASGHNTSAGSLLAFQGQGACCTATSVWCWDASQCCLKAKMSSIWVVETAS